MDVAEISKLDMYLKRLFNSPRIRVVPRPQRDDYAEVLLGEEPFGRIIVDDEDDERSYNFEKSITLPDSKSTKLDNETVAKLNLYLKKHLGEKFKAHKRPTKTDAPTCTRATSSSAWCSRMTAASRSRWRFWSRIWSPARSSPPAAAFPSASRSRRSLPAIP